MQQWFIRRSMTTSAGRLKSVHKLSQTFKQSNASPNKPHQSTWAQKALRCGRWTLVGINALAAYHFLATQVFRIAPMTGISMLPTLAAQGEWTIEEFITKRFFPSKLFARGSLITFHSPLDPDRLACKRIIGLPGDVICVDPTGQYCPSDEHVVIPEGHIWVMGDNASFSRDSRTYGPLPMGLVRGRLVARVWPPWDCTIYRDSVTYLGADKP